MSSNLFIYCNHDYIGDCALKGMPIASYFASTGFRVTLDSE